MSPFFDFEADFISSLRCIPMQVRFKLDTCGIKLKLTHWHQFEDSDRQALVDLPCTTPAEVQHYREFLTHLIAQRTGEIAKDLPIEPQPDWLNAQDIPASVLEKAQEVGIAIALAQWGDLSPIQRFALIKLSRSAHENRNFLPAWHEFVSP
jgi:hypothetical protein